MKTLGISSQITNNTFPTQFDKTVNDHYHNVNLVKVPSYQFRVVEWVNEKDEIVKVGLQSREFTHNQWGSVENNNPSWVDVERVRLKI